MCLSDIGHACEELEILRWASVQTELEALLRQLEDFRHETKGQTDLGQRLVLPECKDLQAECPPFAQAALPKQVQVWQV